MDYLLGLSDEEAPAVSERKEMTDFEKSFGHLEGNEDFLMMAGEYNVPLLRRKLFS